jgi:hypothetical protein
MPNVVVEWLRIFRIREVPDWNLDSVTGHPDLKETSFLQFLQENAGIGNVRFLPHNFQLVIHKSLNAT